MIEYTFIRSKRKTISITVKPDGSVVVKAPLTCSKKRAEAFVAEKQEWIEKVQKKVANRQSVPKFSDAEVKSLKKQAKAELPIMVEELSKLIGVTYGTVSIRAQKSRWGSCSSKGNLNFNCLLMLLPENLRRYVVVHELCHRIEMNHSVPFWQEVGKYQPTFKEDRKQLHQLGSDLLARLP